jgi:hypothetical protein
MSRPKRGRTEKREAARRSVKLAEGREKLFSREPGGSAERPLEVEGAAVIELRARAVPCPLCDGEQMVLEHAAVTVEAERLREVRLQCRRCGSKRSLWFRIALLN